MKKYLLSAFTISSIVTSLFAGCNGNYCSNVQIDKLLAIKNGVVYLDTTGIETSLNCTPIAGKYLALNGLGKNIMYSTLLTAQTTKKLIVVETSADAAGTCLINYVRLAQ